MAALDVLFVNGTVETVTGGTLEAVGVADGRIGFVGTTDDARDHRASDVVDLRGSALLPGLIEPHSHPDLCGQMYSWVDVSGFTHARVDGVEGALRDAVASTAPGEWIFAFGLDPMLTSDIGTWGRDRLDAMAPDHPVVVMIQSMHTLFVNSTALAAAGVDEDTPDPPHGGRFVKDASGRLTGKIEEQPAMGPFVVHGLPDEDAVISLIAEQYERYAAVGITTVGMAGAFVASDAPFLTLADDPTTPLRLVSYARHEHALRVGRLPAHDHDRYRVAGVKLWYDGSPYTGTMLLDEPYLESDLCCCTLGIEPGTTGQANFTPDELTDALQTLRSDGWQVLTHAQGDRACREIVDLYGSVIDRSDHRWRIEHCALITDADLRRAAGIGVSPSFHVDHVRWYGPELASSIIGEERAEGLMPVRSALDAGHRVSLHADSPMYPPGPLRLAATAVTRRTRLGTTIADHQAISALEALRAITIDAAWQLGMDDEVGSIEVGKRADFTVVDRSPLRVEAADLDHLEVGSTWLSGVKASG